MKQAAEVLHSASEKSFKRASIIAAGIVIIIALAVLTGWYLDDTSLTSPFSLDGMNPTVAGCFFLTAISLLFFATRPSGFNWKLACKIIAIFFIIQGSARIIELVGIYDLKLDILLFSKHFQRSSSGEIFGRMAYTSGFVLLLLGIIFLLKINAGEKEWISQFLLLTILVISLFTIISTFYGVKNEYFGKLMVFKMAVSTSVCSLITSVAFLLIDSKRGIMAVIISSEPGGKMVTIFLPIVLLFPLFLGIIDGIADSSGLFQDAFGLALSSIVIMTIFFIVIIRTAKSNNELYRQLLNEIAEKEKAAKEANELYAFANRAKLQRKLDEERLAQQKAILQATVEGQEKERSQIGKELHDNINQLLASVKLMISTTMIKSDSEDKLLAESVRLTDQCIKEIRNLSGALIPLKELEMGLIDAIKMVVGRIRATSELQFDLSLCPYLVEKLNEKEQLTFYRIIQEQVNNIMKHAQAKNVSVVLRESEGNAMLVVADDGKGFNTGNKAEGIGLKNMKSRCELLNGTFSIESQPGEGCNIRVFIPLRPAQLS